VDITPHVELLYALRNQNFKQSTLLAELIDNSLDADASRVELYIGPKKQIRIVDDGVGCKDIGAMLTLGSRYAHKTTKLGRYGIGLKDAALYLWGITTIETVHKGELRYVAVNWPELESSGKWSVPDAVVSSANGKLGTTITFSQITRNLPTVEGMADELGHVFAPALMAGRQIVIVNRGIRKPCVAYQLPPLTDVVEAVFSVEGRGVRLRAGIMLDSHASKRWGFTYQHGHRSIIMNSALGSNGLSVKRIAGVVELDDKWALSKNKDDITELRDELEAAVYEHCSAMLRKADTKARTLESTALADEVSRRLSEALKQAGAARKREARDKGDSTGTVLPKETGRKRRRASKVHDIEGAVERVSRGGIKLEWDDNITGLGVVDLPGSQITLNSSLEFLARLRRDENADAIAILAFTLFVEKVGQDIASHQRYLPTMEPGGVSETLGHVLSGMPGATSEKKARVA
jgi:hypothetical protein